MTSVLRCTVVPVRLATFVLVGALSAACSTTSTPSTAPSSDAGDSGGDTGGTAAIACTTNVQVACLDVSMPYPCVDDFASASQCSSWPRSASVRIIASC